MIYQTDEKEIELKSFNYEDDDPRNVSIDFTVEKNLDTYLLIHYQFLTGYGRILLHKTSHIFIIRPFASFSISEDEKYIVSTVDTGGTYLEVKSENFEQHLITEKEINNVKFDEYNLTYSEMEGREFTINLEQDQQSSATQQTPEEFIKKYYENIASGNLKTAYDKSKQSVPFSTFQSWYKNVTNVHLQNIHQLNTGEYIFNVTLFEGELKSQYEVVMETDGIKILSSTSNEVENFNIKYTSKEKGIEAIFPNGFEIFEETFDDNEGGLLFGPLLPLELPIKESIPKLIHTYALQFIPIQNQKEIINTLNKDEFIVFKPELVKVHNFDVIKYIISGMCDMPTMLVLGEKYNYRLEPGACGSENPNNDFSFYEQIIENFVLIK